MERTRMELVQLGWTSGWHGKRRRRSLLGANLIAFSFLFLYSVCKGDSYPAQRDAGGGGFPMSWSTTRSGLVSFVSF